MPQVTNFTNYIDNGIVPTHRRHPRDSKRSAAYRAEQTPSWRAGETMKTVPEVEEYLARLWQNSLHVEGRRSPKVLPGNGARRGYAYFARWAISLPRVARHEHYILHEVAHLITDSRYGYNTVAAHGQEWAWIYADLVREQMGEQAYDDLVLAFEREGVVKV